LGKEYVSLPAASDPLSITFEEAVELIQKKRHFEQQRQIKTFAENPEVEILNGRYGPYIAMGGKNYKIPAGTDPVSLDLEACMEIIKKAAEKPATTRRRKK
jgi:DNA topoisomerase-1